jgi:hypothetical protein
MSFQCVLFLFTCSAFCPFVGVASLEATFLDCPFVGQSPSVTPFIVSGWNVSLPLWCNARCPILVAELMPTSLSVPESLPVPSYHDVQLGE